MCASPFQQDRSVADFHLDTNRINARQKIEALNRLELWRAAGVVNLDICERVQKEAAAGGDSLRTAKALGQPCWLPLASVPHEHQLIRDIESTLFPGGAVTQSQRNDVEIVFCAAKYGAILVTADGASKRQRRGILGSRDDLKRLGIRVMTADEAVAHVIEQIYRRDRLSIEWWVEMGEPLPEWVGKDAPENNDRLREYELRERQRAG